jgi:hypothetical protein
MVSTTDWASNALFLRSCACSSRQRRCFDIFWRVICRNVIRVSKMHTW